MTSQEWGREVLSVGLNVTIAFFAHNLNFIIGKTEMKLTMLFYIYMFNAD